MSERSYSYSDYSAALSCFRRYKLLKVDSIVPNVADSGDLLFGTAMHAAINAALRSDDAQGVFDLHWNGAAEQDNVAYGRFNWPQLKELGSTFIRKFGERYAKDFRPQVMEQRLYSEYKGIKLEGTPDFLGKYKSDLVVVDWKTSSQNYDKQRAAVGLQLWLYAYLATTALDFKPQKLVYLVFNKATGSVQTPVMVDFSASKMLDILDNMVHYLKLVDVETVFPKNLNACIVGAQRCPFWKECHKE